MSNKDDNRWRTFLDEGQAHGNVTMYQLAQRGEGCQINSNNAATFMRRLNQLLAPVQQPRPPQTPTKDQSGSNKVGGQ
jgi:hypothetical protein